MEKKNKSIILTIVAVATLIALVVGATFAYFQAQGGIAASADVRVTTYTTDLLTFTTGNDIAIYADQANFADGLGNQTGETFARAHLLANNKTNTATANYYVYLKVTNNTFEYTQEDETAELLLQVTDPNGVEVTSLSGLEYKSVTDGKGETVKGFDVTTFDGLVTIANNYEIVANNETTQTWTVKLVFVNLDVDQTANAGNSLSATLKIQKEVLLSEYVKNLYTGIQGENNLYYHNGTILNDDGTVLDADDNSYRYAGSNETTNNFVCFGSEDITCPDDNLYRIIGVFENQIKLIKWDYATNDLLGTDGDYSTDYVSSMSSNNWDIGTSKGTNLQSSIGAYWWNYTDSATTYNATGYYNIWKYSQLNKVNLNINYLKNIRDIWTNKIALTDWVVGGNILESITNSNAKITYYNEIKNPVIIYDTTIYNAKIGLMYVSDYYYSATPTYWMYVGYSDSDNGSSEDYRAAIDTNWMYMGLREWTIVRRSDYYIGRTFDIGSSGCIGHYDVNTVAFAVRPVFYLNSDVTYKSGTGSKTNPITINLD